MERSVKYPILVAVTVATLALGACQTAGQNVYDESEVGQATLVKFGTVVAERPVNVNGQGGAGMLAGGAAGGIAGSAFGEGTGNIAATAAGVLIGGLVGALTEHAITDHSATEYTITLENGKTITIVQDPNPGDAVIRPGDRVMVQMQGDTERVLPAANLPTQIQRPQGIKVTD